MRFGLATLTAAAFGQIFSDVSGIAFGGVVEDLCTKCGLQVPALTAAQRQLRVCKMVVTAGSVCGVVVGCLIGMGSLLFMDLEAAERAKRAKEMDTIFKTVMSHGSKQLHAERSSIFIVDHEKKELWSRYSSDADVIRLPFEKGIVGHVLKSKQALRIEDAHQDAHFDKSHDLATNFTTKSVLCAPVFSDEDPEKVIAVVEWINKKGGAGFTDEDMHLTSMLCDHVSIFMAHIEGSD